MRYPRVSFIFLSVDGCMNSNHLLTNVRMQIKKPPAKYFVCSLATQAIRRMVAYYNRELEPLGLTAQQVMAIGVLIQEENVSLGRFAEQFGVGKAAAVTMIQRLEAQGLVVREPHPTDGRLNVLRITDKTRSLAPQVTEKVAWLEHTLEQELGAERLKNLVETLTVIRDMDL